MNEWIIPSVIQSVNRSLGEQIYLSVNYYDECSSRIRRIFVFNQPSRPTQPGHPLWLGNMSTEHCWGRNGEFRVTAAALLPGLHGALLGCGNYESSSSTNSIATQVLKQNFRAAKCHVLHYSCNVNATVTDSLRCRMICGTVPFSLHAWMPPATAATWSPAAAHSKPLPGQRGRRDRRWSCATTVEHAATVTMQIADAYVTRCRRPAAAVTWCCAVHTTVN